LIDIDGAFFGPTFPALFFMTYENQVPEPAIEHFSPRVFGFKIHQSSHSLPRFRNVPDFRSINNQRSHAFPPHSLVKILSANEEEEESRSRILKQRNLEYPMQRSLLSNNILDSKEMRSIGESERRKRLHMLEDTSKEGLPSSIGFIDGNMTKKFRSNEDVEDDFDSKD
jgi:hypothetical protein